jgi:hypothetical protein
MVFCDQQRFMPDWATMSNSINFIGFFLGSHFNAARIVAGSLELFEGADTVFSISALKSQPLHKMRNRR